MDVHWKETYLVVAVLPKQEVKSPEFGTLRKLHVIWSMWASVLLDIRPVFAVNTASEHALLEQSARTVVEMGGTPLIWYVIGTNADGKTIGVSVD